MSSLHRAQLVLESEQHQALSDPIAAVVLPLPYSDEATQKVIAWNLAGAE